jgi:hypothetical protein
MKEFFASIYEWFGLFPLYSRDLGDHLRGWDITCSDYIGTPWYSYIGWLMLIITLFIYALQYHMIDHPRYNKKIHWWLSALTIVLLNFFTAVLIPYNSIQFICFGLHRLWIFKFLSEFYLFHLSHFF